MGALKIDEIFKRIKGAKLPLTIGPDIKDTKKRAAWELNQEAANLIRLDKYIEAEPKVRAALALDPDLKYAHYNLGTILGMQEKDPESINEFKEAHKLDPQWVDPVACIASTLYYSGKKEESKPYWVMAQGLATTKEELEAFKMVFAEMEGETGKTVTPPR